MTDMQQHLQQPQQQIFQQQSIVLQQQQPQLQQIDCLNLNEQIQLQPIQNIMELVTPQQGETYATFQSDEIKLIQQQQQSQQQQQQQGQQQAQMHTIMFNGQPALFIPASNTGLLCQMLMNSNNNQIYEIIQPQQQQFQLQIGSNSNEFTTLLTNPSNTNHATIANNIQLASTNQNGAITLIQLPATTTNTGTSNTVQGQPMTLCKIENSNELFLQPNVDLQTHHFLQQLNQQQPTISLSSQVDLNEENKSNGKKPARKAKTIRNLTNNSNNKKTNKKVGEFDNNENNNNTNNNNASSANNDVSVINDASSNNENIDNDFLSFDEIKLDDKTQGPTEAVLQHWLLIDGDVNGSQKRKRKACDCPNCIRWRQNIMTAEEMAKKRTHKCHKCSKEYNKTSHLRAHLRAHDNYRPYVCDFKMCGKSFTRSDELKRHKRIHNDDRNFPCQICKKRFLRSDHLSKHLLVHNKTNANSAASTSSSSPSSSLLIKLNAIE